MDFLAEKEILKIFQNSLVISDQSGSGQPHRGEKEFMNIRLGHGFDRQFLNIFPELFHRLFKKFGIHLLLGEELLQDLLIAIASNNQPLLFIREILVESGKFLEKT